MIETHATDPKYILHENVENRWVLSSTQFSFVGEIKYSCWRNKMIVVVILYTFTSCCLFRGQPGSHINRQPPRTAVMDKFYTICFEFNF